MLGTFRKHSTWLWGIIIAAMAVSLVWWTGNRGTGNAEGGDAEFGTLGGKKITAEQLSAAAREVKLAIFQARREWPGPAMNEQLNVEAYKRLFIIHKQEELGIHVSDAEVARMAARDFAAFAKQTGGTVQDFEKQFLAPGGLTLVDYENFLRHRAGEEQLIEAIGLSGELITPKEARAIYERENQELSAQAVFFSASNYLSSVKVTPEALSEYYSNSIARYRIPERVQVSYVEFPATNHWAAAGADLEGMTNQIAAAELVKKYGLHPNFANFPNLAALLDAQYLQKTNFYADVSPEKAKESIKAEIQHNLAMRVAVKLANAFADPLLSDKVKAEALAEQAKKQNLPVKVSEPFDRSEGPTGLSTSEDFARVAFRLTEEEPIAGPIPGENAVFVIARNKQLPSENPPFEAVKARVEQDYKLSQAAQAARSAGIAFAQSVTNGLAQGKAFTTLAAEAKAKPVLLPHFSMSTRSLPEVEDHLSLQQFLQIAFATPLGQASQFIPTMDGGMILYAQSKMALDEKKVAAELPEFINLLRQARQREAFEQWFNREAPQALADTPIVRRAPEVNPAGAAN